MTGGWYSFSGEQGKGGWGRSRMKDILPVKCIVGEDLIESTEGYTVKVCEPDHPAVNGLDWGKSPPLLGFNEC